MTRTNKSIARRRRMAGLAAFALLIMMSACMVLMNHRNVERPAEDEFGFGPRTSESGMYVATLDPIQPIKVGRMQTMRLELRDDGGNEVNGAAVAIDGGMPQHGHGLPTRPRVVGGSDGHYDVQGMKFNMGGWWVVEFAVNSPAGADTVVFNIDL